MSADRDPWRDLARLIALALVAVVIARMVGRLGGVIGLVLFAGTIALLTEPIRRRMARWIPGGLAAALTALVTFVVLVAVGGLVIGELGVQVGRFGDRLIAAIDGLRPGTLPARIAASADARGGVEDALGRLPGIVVTGEEDTVGIANEVIDTLLVLILAAFFQVSGARALDRIVPFWPRTARAEVRAGIGDVLGRGVGYVRRIVMLGVAVWAVVAALATALGLPSPLLLGAWAGLWSAVPWVGPWIGGAPVVATSMGAGGAVAVAGVVATVALWLLVGEVRRRLVQAGRVDLGAAPTAVAVAAGLAIAGPAGLLVCLTVVAIAAAAATSAHEIRRPSRYEVREPDGEAVEPHPWRGARVLVAPDADGGVVIAPGAPGALTVVGSVIVGMLAWLLLGHLGRTVIWIAVAALVAVALHRPVSWIEHRASVPRPIAIGVVSMVAIAVTSAAVVTGLAGWATSSEELGSGLPTVVEDLQTLPVVGPWLEARDAAPWVEDQVENLPQRLRAARDVSELLPTVGARILDLFWVIVLAMALLADGPRLVGAVQRRIPARHRRQAVRIGVVAHAAVGGYLAGAAFVAGINAVVVLVIAVGVGIALAPVLAVWAFVWNFVPQIGGFMGGFPLVVLALAEGPLRAVLAGVLFVAYQFVENHLIQPAVISDAIDVPAWVALLAALSGGAAAGVVGAVVLTPLVGMVRVAVGEIGRDDFPGNVVATGGARPEPAAAGP